MKLQPRPVEKPWGRTSLPGFMPFAGGRRVGEIRFEAPDRRALPLLVKYIFTSERLSIQVHPDDQQAQARGLAHGKSECWYVVDAEPGAMLALGFRDEVDRERLRAAVLDGSIVGLVDWRPARQGDIFSVPAGTVHAIGAGVSLIEVQQSSDVTYRLYDYGRPRELHLEDALAVADRRPCSGEPAACAESGGRRILVERPHFTLVHLARGNVADPFGGRDRFVIPLHGEVDGASLGDCLFVPAGTPMRCSADAELLLAAAGDANALTH